MKTQEAMESSAFPDKIEMKLMLLKILLIDEYFYAP